MLELREFVVVDFARASADYPRPTFVFYERPKHPSFCVVSHVLGLAFDDDAFLSAHIKHPKDIWKCQIPAGRKALPLEWKPSMAHKPLFRGPARTTNGISTSDTRAATFNAMNKYTVRLGISAGLKERFTLYALRRGAGEAINRGWASSKHTRRYTDTR
jgi:hypothetical protein